MRDAEAFDELYLECRERLFIQAYALTGSTHTARNSVRYAFVQAAHHWAKVTSPTERENWIRRIVWNEALSPQHTPTFRRQRDADLTPAATAVLDSFKQLPESSRRLLLLTLLTAATDETIAHETGLDLEVAAKQLDEAMTTHASRLGVETSELPQTMRVLYDAVGQVTWPRPHVLRRRGVARRRGFSVFGTVAAVGTFGLAGMAVASPDGVPLSLNQHRVFSTPGVKPLPTKIPDEKLLDAGQVGRVAPKLDWSARPPSANTNSKEAPRICQTERFADPAGKVALDRDYVAKTNKDGEAIAAQQLELSKDEAAAKASYDRAVKWFAECDRIRAQLVGTYDLPSIGDSGNMFVIDLWDEQATLVAGVARSGRITATTWVLLPHPARVDVVEQATLLAAAVNRLCGHPLAGGCAGPPKPEALRPYPLGPRKGMITEYDLPPVTNIDRPWVGASAEVATTNAAATGCARANFNAKGFTENYTRTFLIPEVKLPDTFGLTQTVGALPGKESAQFVAAVQKKLKKCNRELLGTTSELLSSQVSKNRELYVYRVVTELGANSEIAYDMALMRDGNAVCQLGFFGSGDAQLAKGHFETLAKRALARLASLPRPDTD